MENTLDTRNITIPFSCCDAQQLPLRPNPNIPTEQALAHAANLIGCANELALDVAMGETGAHAAWAAHYLTGMAKAIVDEALTGLARTDDHSSP
ncbi:DUF3077 domain-containing protein [Pseudomonas sp. v388]|uniref:DUF3077 domain-containing protein n=1 Tax=Pseudomonas sp. v388 TaxID=2479849 RepID=UPI000F7BAE1F|nr:DUF3077 domain-containing protein [Pseudomonas sp. v388]RRV08500.1 DUF3077 domain-containing protein [Pseudomonas sp. v388]